MACTELNMDGYMYKGETVSTHHKQSQPSDTLLGIYDMADLQEGP